LKTIEKRVGFIMCVDDDDDDASLLETAVRKYDADIAFVKCYGGTEALAFLSKSKVTPDLILMDVNMPVLNGFDCLIELRKNSRFQHIPVFMLSTSASPRDVAAALELGARRFLTKPNTYQQICSMIQEIIEECLLSLKN
jgi:CheY-like chemotaxis protein